jgi:hypothetical protein
MSSVTPFSARIPFDVHLMILEHCNFRTVHSYALVSKGTTPAASRYLYPDLHWGPSGDIYDWSCNTIQKLLRTLVDRPELALLVRAVNFDVEYIYESDGEETYLSKQRTYAANPESIKLAKKLVWRLRLPDAKSWNSALSQTSRPTDRDSPLAAHVDGGTHSRGRHCCTTQRMSAELRVGTMCRRDMTMIWDIHCENIRDDQRLGW